MSDADDKRAFDFEMLKRYRAKWAVLTAMTMDMARKGIAVPHGVFEGLKTRGERSNRAASRPARWAATWPRWRPRCSLSAIFSSSKTSSNGATSLPRPCRGNSTISGSWAFRPSSPSRAIAVFCTAPVQNRDEAGRAAGRRNASRAKRRDAFL